MRSCAIHVHKHSIEAMPLQQCREVTTVILSITPWLLTYMGQSLIRCNKESDLKFDSLKCKNCTAKAVCEFTVEYDESVAFFGIDQECIGVLGTLRFDEDKGGQINVEVEPLEGVP